MSELYGKHAHQYDQVIKDNIYNAMLDLPSMKRLIGDVRGRRVLDLGAGSGVYAEYFLQSGVSELTCIDSSPQMLALLKQKVARLGAEARVHTYAHDLSLGLKGEADAGYDLVVSALMLHYLEDLPTFFAEVARVLKSGGELVFSTHHPFADYECSSSGNYFEQELVTEEWNTVGEPVQVSFYRRSLTEITQALTDNDFVITGLNEGEVMPEAKALNESTYEYLSTRPNFLFVKARKL
ncbi:class I SAM-dependent methyltransferase [Shewanella submarina]|uniref:Class I SAM-dependent methyltransferase n=1 Tax=Shewanella submarina TaxID=2016376 RepID=A0ABV7GJ84_9GAMM|nr:class I SAM-dependent methyltransferase [Shewanella submarina]MCL1036162.1 class I SAM-dependent methyltransferase [Shewanella submarina]